MKKGSIVELEEEFYISVEELAMLSSTGYPLLLHSTPYMLKNDPLEYTCKTCGDTHVGIELEEFPGLTFNGGHFRELLEPQEVEVAALLDA